MKFSEKRFQELKASLSDFKGSKKQKKAAEKEFSKLQELRPAYISLMTDIKEVTTAVEYLSQTFETIYANTYYWQTVGKEAAKAIHQENLGVFERGLKFFAEKVGVKTSSFTSTLEAYKAILHILQSKLN